MLPSDSDDEAPSGGYYIVEGSSRKPTFPKAPLPDPLTSLIPKVKRQANKQSVPTISTSNRAPAVDTMEPSDSDEEAPPGGYEVRVSDPTVARAAILARNRPRTNGVAEPENHGETPSRASGLARRRTVPARLAGQTRTGNRRGPKEAP